MASPILPVIRIAAAPSRVELEVFKAQSGFVTWKTLKNIHEEVHRDSASITSFGKLKMAGFP